jgi:hypothetical protein
MKGNTEKNLPMDEILDPLENPDQIIPDDPQLSTKDDTGGEWFNTASPKQKAEPH